MDHQEVHSFESLSDSGLVGKRQRRVGSHDIQETDFPGFRGLEYLGRRLAGRSALRTSRSSRQAVGTHSHVAESLRVGAGAQRVHAGARASDVAGEQGQVGDGTYGCDCLGASEPPRPPASPGPYRIAAAAAWP